MAQDGLTNSFSIRITDAFASEYSPVGMVDMTEFMKREVAKQEEKQRARKRLEYEAECMFRGIKVASDFKQAPSSYRDVNVNSDYMAGLDYGMKVMGNEHLHVQASGVPSAPLIPTLFCGQHEQLLTKTRKTLLEYKNKFKPIPPITKNYHIDNGCIACRLDINK